MEENIKPDFVFESSWEVCNKVGGIYTVLSTRAKTLGCELHDNLIFIGPDFGRVDHSLFSQDDTLFPAWTAKAAQEGIAVRVGRWQIPGNPIAVLVDFSPYFERKNDTYAGMWNDFRVDSLHGYGDYDEASMFSYAAGRVVESFYNFQLKGKYGNVIYQAHEWMTGLGALYVRKHVPAIATIFTTHATSIGRSIAGNNKPLYDYLYAYNGNQMAQELNMVAKHSIERQTAQNVDCFTTVSDVTANECRQLLDRACDAVLMNGFESDFVPTASKFTAARKKARQTMFAVANALTGRVFPDSTLIVATSGRYEFKNKGIDVFIESLCRLNDRDSLKHQVLAFVEVPAWVAGPRQDLMDRLVWSQSYETPLPNPVITHHLHNEGDDNVLNMLRWNNMQNSINDNVTIIFVPCYLDGADGIFNLSYYDMLIGNDLCVYPSYYEPWGYTPLESVAFKIPCITTNLSGFGMWVNKEKGSQSHIQDGVEVIERTDYNWDFVADAIANTVENYAGMPQAKITAARKKAHAIAKKALWDNFIHQYWEAYDIALRHARERNKTS